MADVEIDELAVKEFMSDPAGPVTRMLRRAGHTVAALARVIAPKRTGRTASTIRETFEVSTPEGPQAQVEAGGAVLFLQKGTRPHIIKSRGSWPMRAEGPFDFYHGELEHSGDERVFGEIVFHPGSHKQPFLTYSLWSLRDLLDAEL